MTPTYCIDPKRKKAQSEYVTHTPERLPLEEAAGQLRFPPSVRAAEGIDDAKAALEAFFHDPVAHLASPSPVLQEALWGYLASGSTPAPVFSLFLAWRGPEGLTDLVLRGGAYRRSSPERGNQLERGNAPLSSWPLVYALAFLLKAAPSVRPRLQAQCRAEVVTLDNRTVCALLFDEPEWANDLAREWLATRDLDKHLWSMSGLVGTVSEPELFHALLAGFGKRVRYMGSAALLGRSVGRLPAPELERGLVALLDRGLGEKWKSSHAEPFAKALSHVRSLDAARVLAAWVGEKSCAKVADAYFRTHPDLAEVALGPVAGGKGKAAPVAKALLESLGRETRSKTPAGSSVAPPEGDARTQTSKTAPRAKPKKEASAEVAAHQASAATAPEPAPLALLRSPPWASKSRPPRPRLDLALVVETESCTPSPDAKPPLADASPERDARVLRGHPPTHLHESALFSLSPGVAIAGLEGRTLQSAHTAERLLGWLGEAAVPYVIAHLCTIPSDGASLLARARSARLALPCAHASARAAGGPERTAARAWLLAHPELAALGLVPAALGADDADAFVAERALLRLQAAGRAGAVRDAAARYGEEAQAALAKLLTRSPAERIPPKRPTQPKWASAERLGAPLALAAGGSLAPDDVNALVQLLQLSEVATPFPGVIGALALLAPHARAGLAKALLEEFVVAGSPPSQEWVLDATALADAATALRELPPRMRAWASDGKVPLLHRSLEVLAALGTDEALVLVFDAGQRSRYDDTRAKVHTILEEVARARGLSPDELEDALVPELGLEGGPVALELGGRTLHVALGAHLEAELTDGGGARLGAFPRKSKADSAEAYASAKARFDELVEAAEAVGRSQVLRFERALRSQRTWTVGSLRGRVLPQPLVTHLARRLVWQRLDTGELFRVAEDLTLADADDSPVPFPPDHVRVVLAHPLRAPGLHSFGAWLDDYRVLQPFEQVRRTTCELEPHEATASRLDRFAGKKADYLAVLALTLGLGWKPVAPGEKGIDAIVRELSGGRVARLELSPGLLFGPAKGRPEQRLGGVTLEGPGREPASFGDLETLERSELLRDVTRLAM